MSYLLHMREQVDKIDRAILDLVNARIYCVLKIAQMKRTQRSTLHDPKREHEIILGLQNYNKGPLSQDSVRLLFQEILKLSKHYMSTTPSKLHGLMSVEVETLKGE